WVVVHVTSTSGVPFATRALDSRTTLFPTSYSTGTPVLAVKGLLTTRSIVSFQFAPQVLTTRGSAASPTGTRTSSEISAMPRIPQDIGRLLPERSSGSTFTVMAYAGGPRRVSGPSYRISD